VEDRATLEYADSASHADERSRGSERDHLGPLSMGLEPTIVQIPAGPLSTTFDPRAYRFRPGPHAEPTAIAKRLGDTNPDSLFSQVLSQPSFEPRQERAPLSGR
jgi:hypothetical protein